MHASPMKHSLLTLLIILAAACLPGCRTIGETHSPVQPPTGIPSSSQPRLAPVRAEEARLPSPVAQAQFSAESDPALTDPAPPATGGQSYRLEDLQELALGQNPAVAQAAARVEALRGRWVQVGLPANPTLGYMAEEMGDAGTSGMQGGFLSQEYVLQRKRDLSRARVAQEILQAEQSWWVERQRVLTDVQVACYDVLVAQRRLEVAHELVQISDSAVTASKALLRAAEISTIALLQAEIEAEQTRITLQRAENENRLAWQQLVLVIGVPQLPAGHVEGDLDEAVPEVTWEESLDRLLGSSPELAAAVADIDVAQAALRRAAVEPIPNPNVMVQVQRMPSGDAVTGVQFGLPIPLFDRNQGSIREARADIVRAERNFQRVELNLAQRLAVAFRSYADARFQVESYTTSILEKARQNLQLVESAYQQGELDYLTLLTAQRTYFEINLAYIGALRELRVAVAEIDGLLLRGSLDSQR